MVCVHVVEYFWVASRRLAGISPGWRETDDGSGVTVGFVCGLNLKYGGWRQRLDQKVNRYFFRPKMWYRFWLSRYFYSWTKFKWWEKFGLIDVGNRIRNSPFNQHGWFQIPNSTMLKKTLSRAKGLSLNRQRLTHSINSSAVFGEALCWKDCTELKSHCLSCCTYIWISIFAYD